MSQPRLHQALAALYDQRDSALLEFVLNHPEFTAFMRLHGVAMPMKALVTAFTHTSFAHEYNVPHQEQMEFLGDAVLQLILTEELCRRYPREKEGRLSKMRSSLVNEKTLSQLSVALELNDLILSGKGEFKKGLVQLESVQADTFEALVSQIYLHQGYDVVRALVLKWFMTRLYHPFDLEILETLDAKSRLQEKSLALFKKLPRYSAEAHGEQFEVKLWLNEEVVATGIFTSKKNGEKELAQNVLDKGIL